MRIRLRANIGTKETPNISPPLLDGQERDVDESLGRKLVERGLAVDITPPPPAPTPTVHAVPGRPEIADAKAPEIMPEVAPDAEDEPPHAEAEAELKAYGDKQKRKPKHKES